MEETLVSKLIQGDEESYRFIIDEYKVKILRVCYPYTKDLYEAEDLSQEVFMTIFKNIKNFKGKCSLATYIYRISISRCLDYKRKKSIKEFLVDTFKIDKPAPSEDNIEKNYIRDCIKKLPPRLKEVVVLYYYADLTQKEIGSILNISEKAVEGRIYRAKEKLKIEFQKGEGLTWRREEMI